MRDIIKITNSSQCEWISAGQTIKIQGFTLNRGCFYLGKYFKASKNLPNNIKCTSRSKVIYRSVINPDLPVVKGTANEKHFSSYYDLSPELRYKYLLWLGHIIDTTDLPDSLIDMYICGVQVRLFLDIETTDDERESLINTLIAIRTELAASSYMKRVIENLIDQTMALFFLGKSNKFRIKDFHLFIYKRALIAKSAAQIYIGDANAAFDIFTSMPEFESIPEFCKGDVKEHFHLTFKKFRAQPLGNCKYQLNFDLTIWNTKTDVVSYSICIIYSQYDFYSLQQKLEGKFKKITDDFRIYNHIIKYIDTPLAPIAYFSLPGYIKRINHSIEKSLKKKINELIADKRCVIKIDFLLNIFCVNKQNKTNTIPKDILDLMFIGLNQVNIGLVPNYQLGHPRVNYGDYCVIFRQPKKHQISIDIIREQTILIKLLSIIQQNVDLTFEDRGFISNCIAEIEKNNDIRFYLESYFEWLTLKKQTLDKKTKEEYSKLHISIKNKYVKFLLQSTYVNGDLNEKRTSTLQKLLTSLGYTDNIHDLLQRVMIDSDNFIIDEAPPITLMHSSANTSHCTTNMSEIEATYNEGKCSMLQINTIIVITTNGFIKKFLSDEFQIQETGSLGTLKNHFADQINVIKEVPSQGELLIFTQHGICHRINILEIPNTKIQKDGISLYDKLGDSGDAYCAVLSIAEILNNKSIEDVNILIMTKMGKIISTRLKDYIKRNKFKIIELEEGDNVVSVASASRNDLVFNCSNVGYGKLFEADEVKTTALRNKGVNCYNFSPYSNHYNSNAELVGLDTTNKDNTSCIIITKHGYLCRTDIEVIGRATTGYRLIKLKENDTVVCNLCINDADNILVITKKGYTIRLNIRLIKERKHGLQGNACIKLTNDDEVVACCKLSSSNGASNIINDFAVVEKTTDAVSYTIPKPSEKMSVIHFDKRRLKKIEKQTKEAQDILSKIFVEDELVNDIKQYSDAETIRSILIQLFEKEVWTQKELDTICSEKGLMTNYVLEKINDYSYEKVNDSVIDQDGDNIYVTKEYKDMI